MRITERDIARYTLGDCHIFARALNLVSGWTIHTFMYGGSPMWHAFVIDTDGHAVDIEGRCDIESFKARWDQEEISPWTWEGLMQHSYWRGTHFKRKQRAFGEGSLPHWRNESYSYCRARDLARLLIDQLDSNPRMP